MEKSRFEDKLLFCKYKPIKKIGEGSFGKIYLASNIFTNERFALKIESRASNHGLLEQEAYVLCSLKGDGIPSVKSYGYSGDSNILVMELLGKSLESLFQEKGGRFSMKTVCMLGIQMLHRLEYIHSKHVLHRDIKPDNFIMGIEDKSSVVYAIDFGLSKKYRSSRTLQHIQLSNNKKLVGTARYASINALKGYEQGRRDDLEAVGYVLLYFLRGSLPWQGLKVDKKEDRYKKICEKKRTTAPEVLCAGFPKEFAEYVAYARNLDFEQTPDYDYLRSLLQKALLDNDLKMDNQFDWLPNKTNHLSVNSFPTNVIGGNQPNRAHLEHEVGLNNPKDFGDNSKKALETGVSIDHKLSSNNNEPNSKTTNTHPNPEIKVKKTTTKGGEENKMTKSNDGICLIF